MEQQPVTSSSTTPARAGFSAWFEGEAGNMLARYEKEKLDRILPGLFGYHIAQIGHYDGGALESAGCIRHKIELRLDADGARDGGALLASGASLPFAARSIDAVLLPHVLEYASDPGAVLKETERVLIEDGRLIVAGFSPWSLWGLGRLNPVWRNRPPWDGRFHSTARLRRWLSMLGLEVLEVERFLFRPPCKHEGLQRRLLFLERLGAFYWPLLGAAYIVVAQKRRVPVTPIKLSWRKRLFLSGAPAGPATMTEADRSLTTERHP